MTSTTGVFIGHSTLLVRCAEHYLHAGHAIALICSRSPLVETWARDHNITFLSAEALEAGARALQDALASLVYDDLFSIANLTVLPRAVIDGARRRAVNFHDGPLPHYAGLNAPHWALLAGETTYAATWHEMTDQVDAGRILRQAPLQIEAGDTAFSLNAKIYAAAASSFPDVLELLERGSRGLAQEPNVGTMYTADMRPAAAGIIDVNSSAGDVVRLVRALDAGAYWSPLGYAKLDLGHTILSVRSAEVLPDLDRAPAGTILSASPTAIDIAVADGAVRLTQLETLAGHPITDAAIAGCSAGDRLASREPRARIALTSAMATSAKSEPRWLRRLSHATAFDNPYPTHSKPLTPIERAMSHIPLAVSARSLAASVGASPVASSLASLASWLSQLSAISGANIHLAVLSPATLAASAAAPALFFPAKPTIIPVSPHATARALARTAEFEVAATDKEGPLARDLIGRLARTDAPLAGLPAPHAALVVDTRELGDDVLGASLALRLDTAADTLALVVDSGRYDTDTAATMATHLTAFLRRIIAEPDKAIAGLSLVPDAEARIFADINADARHSVETLTIDQAFARQAARNPDRLAIRAHDAAWSYSRLDERRAVIAHALRNKGIGRGDTVAISLSRTPDMIATLLAVLSVGAAYVPIDPAFPLERRRYIFADSTARLLITDGQSTDAQNADREHTLRISDIAKAPLPSPDDASMPSHDSTDRAYLMYTSGSTGNPKGVVVTHANVANFFAGMDARVPFHPRALWLAVTSISFDISVLELLWTLTRGITIALYAPVEATSPDQTRFSLFYFAAGAEHAASEAGSDGYRLLLEGARFADANGFEAVWTPERHFHGFGAPYPNPAVTGAAVAAVTKHVAIRAGSCVLPLHDPIRVAEDWSVIDNLSGGRAGIAIASGWMPEDFVLAPEAFAERHKTMLAHIDTVQALWRGDRISRRKPDGTSTQIATLPRPVQPMLPVWITAARNPETFRLAGSRGANVLTHLLGMSRDDLAANIALYRKARAEAGHAGPGRVTLMLHTFVGPNDDAVREIVRAPMKRYLASSVDLVRAAAWTFPTFSAAPGDKVTHPASFDPGSLTAEELDAVLEHAFDRYYRTSGLFGTPVSCAATARALEALGVNEFACLIDFGVATDTVLQHLPHLKAVMDRMCGESQPISVAAALKHFGATHLQCTPSMAAMLLADTDGRDAVGSLETLLVGGEAIAPGMARDLSRLVRGPVLNMYGPTETTVWSATSRLSPIDDTVDLGRPIANTTLHVRDAQGRDCPALVPGELLIGGAGVAAGYWQRDALTAERFVESATADGNVRLYRTGDLVRRHGDGRLEFLGRIDHQIKIRGHRIELGEIEAAIADDPSIEQSVVIARSTNAGNELHAYVTAVRGNTVDVAALKRRLLETLPEIMVPPTITVLSGFPMTPNMKVDRKALASAHPVPPASADTVSVPARTARPALATIGSSATATIERDLTALWSRLLGCETVASTSNFFDLGGHSLMAVQMHRALHDTIAPTLVLTDIFRFPTIATLAAHIAHLQDLAVATLPATAPRMNEGARRAATRLAMTRRERSSLRGAGGQS